MVIFHLLSVFFSAKRFPWSRETLIEIFPLLAPPKEDPEITGEQKFYQIGDVLNLNCTSGKSFPPARLKWFVNDLQVEP